MSKLTLQHPHSGIIKSAPLGFSWTTLFFCFVPALCRGDFKWGLIQFILSPLVIPQLFFAFKYNRIYLQRRLEQGYKVKNTGGSSLASLNERLQIDLPVLSAK